MKGMKGPRTAAKADRWGEPAARGAQGESLVLGHGRVRVEPAALGLREVGEYRWTEAKRTKRTAVRGPVGPAMPMGGTTRRRLEAREGLAARRNRALVLPRKRVARAWPVPPGACVCLRRAPAAREGQRARLNRALVLPRKRVARVWPAMPLGFVRASTAGEAAPAVEAALAVEAAPGMVPDSSTSSHPGDLCPQGDPSSQNT